MSSVFTFRNLSYNTDSALGRNITLISLCSKGAFMWKSVEFL